jgi:hypothetical protein
MLTRGKSRGALPAVMAEFVAAMSIVEHCLPQHRHRFSGVDRVDDTETAQCRRSVVGRTHVHIPGCSGRTRARSHRMMVQQGSSAAAMQQLEKYTRARANRLGWQCRVGGVDEIQNIENNPLISQLLGGNRQTSRKQPLNVLRPLCAVPRHHFDKGAFPTPPIRRACTSRLFRTLNRQ